jgi:hypothetical protein
MVAAVLLALRSTGGEAADRRAVRLAAGRVGGAFVAAALAGGWWVAGLPVSLGLYDRVVQRLAGAQAAPTPFEWGSFLAVLGDHWTLLVGAFALAVPLLVWRAGARAPQSDAQRFFFRFATLYLVLQTVAVSWYTLTSSEAGRVHSRYYGFVLPALALAVAVPLRELPRWPVRLAQSAVATAGLALFWLGMVPAAEPKIRNAFVGDSPELVLVRADPGLAAAVGGTALVAAIGWALGARASRRLAAGALAVAVVASFLLLQKHRTRETRRALAFRAAGDWITAVVPREALDAGAFVTPYGGHAYAALFFVPGAPDVLKRPGPSRLRLPALARRYDWVYVPPGAGYRIEGAAGRPMLADRRGTLVDLTDRNLFGIRTAIDEAAAPP